MTSSGHRSRGLCVPDRLPPCLVSVRLVVGIIKPLMIPETVVAAMSEREEATLLP